MWHGRVFEGGWFDACERIIAGRRLFHDGLRRAADGRSVVQQAVVVQRLVVQRLVQLVVGVGSALGVRVLVVGGVAAVCAVHAVLAAWGRQVRQAVVVKVQIVFGRTVRLKEGRRDEREAERESDKESKAETRKQRKAKKNEQRKINEAEKSIVK